MAKTKTAAPAQPSPAHSTTAPKHVNDVPASRCKVPGCNSTERTRYHGVTFQTIAGLDPEGKPYNRVVWRNTTCKACGQARVDRTFENVADDAEPALEPHESI
ncbi:MAG: hypothetical protein KGL39_22620 [Patescibacteria group bacterium]|nr:hypothetical protein [Patescibacteria group bacterium]